MRLLIGQRNRTLYRQPIAAVNISTLLCTQQLTRCNCEFRCASPALQPQSLALTKHNPAKEVSLSGLFQGR